MSKYDKIQQLQGPTTPKAFAGMLVEHGDDIKDIACIVQWKKDAKVNGGNTTCHTTEMQDGDLAWLDYVWRMWLVERDARQRDG